nr:tyrosine-type recombinase/integrase [Methanosarcina sp. KYL-1]
MGIYDYKNNKGLRNLESRIKDATYSEANKKSILDFENYLFAEGIKTIRVLKYLMQLNTLAEMFQEINGKNFSEMDRLDIQAVVARIERSDLAEWTKRDYKVTIRRFFSWLQGENNAAAWVKTTVKMNARKLPDNLLTEEEIKRMIEAADHTRDKAIIAILYDSGCRIGELGGLQIKNVNFDQFGAVLSVQGKTGARRVRVIFSVPYLAAWLDVHSDKENPEAYIFVMLRGKGKGKKQMQYAALTKIIKNAAKKAGIKKRVHNHLFRHSRSTELAQHLTEAQMEAHLGWVHGSNMPATYVHLSGKQVDDAMLRIYGMKKKEDMLPELTSKPCPICEKINGPTSKFCTRCGHPLDQQTLQEINEIENKIPELLQLVMKSDAARELFSKFGRSESN